MSELPVKQKDYDNAVMILEFLKAVQYTFDNIDFKYIPTLKGYEIKDSYIGISIHKPHFPLRSFKVEFASGEKVKKYKLKNKSEIQDIVNDMKCLYSKTINKQ